jgi:hypothetical protein
LPAPRAALETARVQRAKLIDELRAELGEQRLDDATRVLHEVLRARGAVPEIRQRRVRPPT